MSVADVTASETTCVVEEWASSEVDSEYTTLVLGICVVDSFRIPNEHRHISIVSFRRRNSGICLGTNI